jgi:hypothetical protein
LGAGEVLGSMLERGLGGSGLVKSKKIEGEFRGSKNFGMTIMNSVNFVIVIYRIYRIHNH